MSRLKHIVIVSNFWDNFFFFARLADTLKIQGIRVTFLTVKYALWREMISRGWQTVLVKRNPVAEQKSLPEKVLEIPEGGLTPDEALRVHNAIQHALPRLMKSDPFDGLMMWSGVRLVEKSVTTFAIEHAVPTLYLELGNFPGKIFADSLGTNVSSSLAMNPASVLGYQHDPTRYAQWRDDYLRASLQTHAVPQGKDASSLRVKPVLKDYYGYLFHSCLKSAKLLPFGKLWNKLLLRYAKLPAVEIPEHHPQYFFYPMQVSDDAQILLNSPVDNEAAIRYAAAQASQSGYALIVKPHPAERNFSFMKRIAAMQQELGFTFAAGNTMKLMQRAEKIITVNSTAGLQAKILGKDVEVLGSAFWKGYGEQELAAYIHGFLIDCPFWGTTAISPETAGNLLSRYNSGGDSE